MHKNIYSIGEVSKKKDISIKALRYYDHIGLLKPYHVDTTSRYRFYHASQFIYIDIIKASRAMDISPNDLVQFFGNKDTEGIIKLLGDHRDKTLKRIKNLEDIANGIDQIITACNNSRNNTKKHGVYKRRLPERYVITAPFEEGKTDEEYAAAYAELDAAVSRLGLFNTYQAGLLFAQNEMREFFPANLFTTISGVAGGASCCLIPGGDYLCVCYERNTAQKQQQKLLNHLKCQNLQALNMVQLELIYDLFDDERIIFELECRVGS